MESQVKMLPSTAPAPAPTLPPPSSPPPELSYEQLFSFQVTYTNATGYPTQKKKKKWKRAILQVDFSMKAFFLHDKDQIYLSQVFTSLQQHPRDEYTGSCRLAIKFNSDQWNLITQNQAEKQCLQHLLQCILDNTLVEDAAVRGQEKGVIGLDKTVIKHGTVQRKTAHEVKMSNRFLVLVPGKLLFFKGKDIVGKNIRYVTTLVGATVRMVTEQIELQIVAPNSKAIAIVASDIKELTSWSTSITIAMDCAKNESKKSESSNTSSTPGSSDTEPVEILPPNGETQKEKKHEQKLINAKLGEWEGRSTRRGHKRNGSTGRTRALFCLDSAIDDMEVIIGKIKAEKRQASAPPEYRFTSANNQFREESGDHIHPEVIEEPISAPEDQTSEHSVQRREIEGRANGLLQMIDALVPQLKIARESRQGSLSVKDQSMPRGSTSILPRASLQIHDQQMLETRSKNTNYAARMSSAAFQEQPLSVNQQHSNSSDEDSMVEDHVHAEGIFDIGQSLVEDDQIRRRSLEKEKRRESEGKKKSLIDSSSRRGSNALSPERMPRERPDSVLSAAPSMSSKRSSILRDSQSYKQPIQDTRSKWSSLIPRTSSSTFQESYPSVGAQKNNSSTEDSIQEEVTIQTPGVVSGEMYSVAQEKRKDNGGGANIFFPTKKLSLRKESIPTRLVIERASSLSSKSPARSGVRVSQSYVQSLNQDDLLNDFLQPSFSTDNSESSIENRAEEFSEPQKHNFNAMGKNREIVIDTSEEDESQSTNEELAPQERGTEQGRTASGSSLQRNSQLSPTKNPSQVTERKSISQGTTIGSLSRNSYVDVEVHKEQDESAASEGYSESSSVYQSHDRDNNSIGGKQNKQNSLKPSELKLSTSRASVLSAPQKRPSKDELAGLEADEARQLGSKRNSRNLSSRDENEYRGGEDGNKGRRSSSRKPYLQTHDGEEPHPFAENSIRQNSYVPEQALETSATNRMYDSNDSISSQAHSSEEERGAVLGKQLSAARKSWEQGQNRGSMQQVSSSSSDTTTKPSPSKQYLRDKRPSALLPQYSISSKPGKNSLAEKRQSQREARIDRSPSLVTDSRTKLSQIKSSSSDSSESLRSSTHQSPRGTEDLTDLQKTNKEGVFSPKHSVNSGDQRESQQLRPVSLMNNPLDLQEVGVPIMPLRSSLNSFRPVVGDRMDDGEREEKTISSLPSVEPKEKEDSQVFPQKIRTSKYGSLMERRQSQERVREFSATNTLSDIQDSLSSSSFKNLRHSRLHEKPAAQETSELGDRKESVEPKTRSSKFRPSLANMEQSRMPETDKASDNFKVETMPRRGSTNRDRRQSQSQMQEPQSQSKEEEMTDAMKPNIRTGSPARSILRMQEESGGIIASSPHYQNPQLEEERREGDVENLGFQDRESTKQMQEPFYESIEAGTQRGDTRGSFNRSSFRNARESQMQKPSLIASSLNYQFPEDKEEEFRADDAQNLALRDRDSKQMRGSELPFDENFEMGTQKGDKDRIKSNTRGSFNRSSSRSTRESLMQRPSILASSSNYQFPEDKEEEGRADDVKNLALRDRDSKQMRGSQLLFDENFEMGTQKGDNDGIKSNTRGSFNRSSSRSARESQIQRPSILASSSNYQFPEDKEAEGRVDDVQNLALRDRDSKQMQESLLPFEENSEMGTQKGDKDGIKPNTRGSFNRSNSRNARKSQMQKPSIKASSLSYQFPDDKEEEGRADDAQNLARRDRDSKQMQGSKLPFDENFERGTLKGDKDEIKSNTRGSFNRSSFRNARESRMQEPGIITSLPNYPSPEVDGTAIENVENIALGYKNSKYRSSFKNAQQSQMQDSDPYDESFRQDDEPNIEDPTFRFSFDMRQRGVQDMERTTEEYSEEDPRVVQPQTRSYSNRMKFPSQMDESSSQSDDSSETKETTGGLEPNSSPEYSYNRIKLSKIDDLEQRAQIESQSDSSSEDGIRTPQQSLYSAGRRPNKEEYEREFPNPQSNRFRSQSRKQSQAEMPSSVSSSEDGIITPPQSFNSEGRSRSQRRIQEEYEQEFPVPKSTLQPSQSRRQSESEMLSSDSESENEIRAYWQRMNPQRKRQIQVESDQDFPTPQSTLSLPSQSRRQSKTERPIPDSSSEDEIRTPNQTFHSAPKRASKEEYEKELPTPQSRRQSQTQMQPSDPRSEDGTRTRQQSLHSAGKRQSQVEYEMDAHYIQEPKLRADRKSFHSPSKSRLSLQFEPGARRFMNICKLCDGTPLPSQICKQMEQKCAFPRSSASTIHPRLVQLTTVNIGSRRYKRISMVINLDSQRCNSL